MQLNHTMTIKLGLIIMVLTTQEDPWKIVMTVTAPFLHVVILQMKKIHWMSHQEGNQHHHRREGRQQGLQHHHQGLLHQGEDLP